MNSNYLSVKAKHLDKEDSAPKWTTSWDWKKINRNREPKTRVSKDKWQMAIIRNSFIIQLKIKFNTYILKRVMSFHGTQKLPQKRLLSAKISSTHFYMKLTITLEQSHRIDLILMEFIIGKLLLMLEQNMNSKLESLPKRHLMLTNHFQIMSLDSPSMDLASWDIAIILLENLTVNFSKKKVS